ncbi:hypothetical protein CLV31_11218 [Algoriphagus aquaeductus]|uniref:Uncharacterized protein n=1 Tax=Algoriphagus aquaeductus TaxID=475299 RepID=A0A326RNV8_9BACT|nr:hypothetical protein CLV31_11218 [Algoriphagus aquaeductus]
MIKRNKFRKQTSCQDFKTIVGFLGSIWYARYFKSLPETLPGFAKIKNRTWPSQEETTKSKGGIGRQFLFLKE